MLGIHAPRRWLDTTLLAAAASMVACGTGTASYAPTTPPATAAPVTAAPANTAEATPVETPASTVAPTVAPAAPPIKRAPPAPTAVPAPTRAAPAVITPTPVPTAPPPSTTTVIVVAGAGGQGSVLVAASNRMTLYMFNSDVAGSGASNCNGGCATTWPPLTVPPGTTPGGGPGVGGRVGTIRRSTGALQVTYNGLPLYLYSGDHAPGDTNGNYPGWSPARP
jgi:predicted lipoprotein with Yx(FWY)xxD motif